jgi:aldehyde:ferredoxin oxidoreductase
VISSDKSENQQKEPRDFKKFLEASFEFQKNEGERLVLVTPNVGVLTLEGSEALVMAVLEDGVDALETGGVTGVVGEFM